MGERLFFNIDNLQAVAVIKAEMQPYNDKIKELTEMVDAGTMIQEKERLLVEVNKKIVNVMLKLLGQTSEEASTLETQIETAKKVLASKQKESFLDLEDEELPELIEALSDAKLTADSAYVHIESKALKSNLR